MGDISVKLSCEFCRTCILFTSQLTSVIAAVLFTVHPVHTEAVSVYNIKHKQEAQQPPSKSVTDAHVHLLLAN